MKQSFDARLLHSSPVCAVSEVCCNTLLIDFRWEISKGVFFHFKWKKPHNLVWLLCSFSECFNHCLHPSQKKKKSVASYTLSIPFGIFAALKYHDVQSTAGGLSVTVTMFATLPFCKFICEQLSELTFLSLSSETVHEILNLVLCTCWLWHTIDCWKDFCPTVTLMICWLWCCYASLYFVWVTK